MIRLRGRGHLRHRSSSARVPLSADNKEITHASITHTHTSYLSSAIHSSSSLLLEKMPTLVGVIHPSFKTIRDSDRQYPHISADIFGFPEGWLVRRIPKNKSSPSIQFTDVEDVFFSPKLNLRLSKVDNARRFLDCLRKCGDGNEAAATHFFNDMARQLSTVKKRTCSHEGCQHLAMKGVFVEVMGRDVLRKVVTMQSM